MTPEDAKPTIATRWLWHMIHNGALGEREGDDCLGVTYLRQAAEGTLRNPQAKAHLRDCKYCLLSLRYRVRAMVDDYLDRHPIPPPCECERWSKDCLGRTGELLKLLSLRTGEEALWDPWEAGAVEVVSLPEFVHEKEVPRWAALLRGAMTDWLVNDPPEEVSADAMQYRRELLAETHWPTVACLMLKMAAWKHADNPAYGLYRLMFVGEFEGMAGLGGAVLDFLRQDERGAALVAQAIGPEETSHEDA